MRKALSILGSLAVAGCAGAACAEVGPITMHKVGAGTPDTDGWVHAESTNGFMKADTPCAYNDFTTREPDQSAAVSTSFAIGCKRDDGVKFSVVRTVYRGGEQAAAAVFLPGHFDTAMAFKKLARLTVNGVDAIDASVANRGHCGEFRLVRAGRDNIFLALEAPSVDCAQFTAVRDRFFGSLEVGSRPDA